MIYDRGYNDYQWFFDLNKKGVYFVTRLKRNAKYRVLERREINKKRNHSPQLVPSGLIVVNGY